MPFFKTVAIYLVLDTSPYIWLTCLLKCLPIIWLCIFVVLHGISFGDKHLYSRRVLFGLVLSCLGDALLVWPTFFLWGMLAFGLVFISLTLILIYFSKNQLKKLIKKFFFETRLTSHTYLRSAFIQLICMRVLFVLLLDHSYTMSCIPGLKVSIHLIIILISNR